MATAVPANHLGQPVLQPIDADDAKDYKKYPHTLVSGTKFLFGVSMIAVGLLVVVASCAVAPVAPVAAVPVALTFLAVILSGRNVLKKADQLRLADHGFFLQKPSKEPRFLGHNI